MLETFLHLIPFTGGSAPSGSIVIPGKSVPSAIALNVAIGTLLKKSLQLLGLVAVIE